MERWPRPMRRRPFCAGSRRLIASRRQSAIQRISQTGMFLQSQGLIKKIRKEDVRREIPAAWLLLIGDDEENREVEAYARECLGLSSC